MLTLTRISILLGLIFAGHEVHGRHGHEKHCYCDADQEEPWSYCGNNGPEFWWRRYPTCGGQQQSPININTHSVHVDPALTPVVFENYDKPIKRASVVNNGHTVQLTPEDNDQRSIQNGGLAGVYVFSQLHFHWGCNDKKGSEHQIDGHKYPMEMHLVHTDTENRIAVIGVFLKETSEDNPALAPLVKILKDVKYKDDRTALTEDFDLEALLPKYRFYFRYEGSLTTPPCTEGVKWTVLKYPINIGCDQIEAFRKLYSTSEIGQQCNIVNNYRPIQPKNRRIVWVPPKQRNW